MSTNTTTKLHEAITFADILFIIKKNIILLLAITIGFGIVGGVYGFKYTKPSYTAISTAMIAKESNVDIDYGLSLNLVQTFQQLFTSEAVYKKTSEVLSDKYEQEIHYNVIKSSTEVTIEQYGLMITIKATSSIDDQFAIDIANQLLDSCIEYANNDLVTDDGFRPLAGKIMKVDKAESAIRSDKSMTVFIASILIGFALGVMCIVLRYLLNDTYTSREEYEKQTGSNVLVVLPYPVNEGDSNAI